MNALMGSFCLCDNAKASLYSSMRKLRPRQVQQSKVIVWMSCLIPTPASTVGSCSGWGVTWESSGMQRKLKPHDQTGRGVLYKVGMISVWGLTPQLSLDTTLHFSLPWSLGQGWALATSLSRYVDTDLRDSGGWVIMLVMWSPPKSLLQCYSLSHSSFSLTQDHTWMENLN